MSTDQQRAIVSLALVVQTCNAALTAVPPEPSPHSLAVLHSDMLSLLALLYAAVTKISLALKPSSPAFGAALAPLKDISEHSSALFHCASHFIPQTHGAALVQEVESVVKDAMECIRALAQCFLDIESSGVRTGSGLAGDEYMVRTATAHSVFVRKLSSSNLEAVRKRWSDDAASLDDGYREVGDMIEDAASAGDADVHFDDGWDELGLGKDEPLSPDELERTKKVHRILRLVQLLHKRILNDVLSIVDISTLDALASGSRALLCGSDELVATLYSPQDLDKIRMELASFRQSISQLQSSLNSLELQSANLTLGSDSTKHWLDTCFVQVYKAVDGVLDESHLK
ncbi:hypothetical protein C8F01DRAFT_1250857 [Mycena amicta]|nr:hypothetical protein C8F01DRAFT_1250857 [Mycena amicta]